MLPDINAIITGLFAGTEFADAVKAILHSVIAIIHIQNQIAQIPLIRIFHHHFDELIPVYALVIVMDLIDPGVGKRSQNLKDE
jgi:hypothetical protein